MKHYILSLLLCAGLLCAAGCSSDDSPKAEAPAKDIIIMFASPAGQGDSGYNDLLINGVSAFAYGHDIDFYLVNSSSIEEAAEQYEGFLFFASLMEDDSKALVILASSEYEDIARMDVPHGESCSVLLLESDAKDMPEWVSTAKVNRYGACWLAGAMVSEQPAEIIMAMPGESITEEAAAGFEAGFMAHTNGKTVRRHYLSDDYRGFLMQVEANRLTSSIIDTYNRSEVPYCTFLPLAGGSNLGVYNAFTRFVHAQQAIGMDIDCSGQNDYIPFSIVVRIDRLLHSSLTQWLSDGSLPRHVSHGLLSDYITIAFSDSWDPLGLFCAWDGNDVGILPENFWETRFARYLTEAVEKEKEYESK